MPALLACGLAARHIPHKDEWYTGNVAPWNRDDRSDPWVKIAVGGTTCQSAVVHNSADPEWNKCCPFGCAVSPCTVVFTVYDKDLIKDDNLGRVELSSDEAGERWVALREGGELKVSITQYLPPPSLPPSPSPQPPPSSSPTPPPSPMPTPPPPSPLVRWREFISNGCLAA